MDEGLVKKLLSNIKCSICGRHYEPAHIKVLKHREDLWFLSVFCPACKSQGLVAAVIREDRAPEIVTELTDDEISKFAASPSLESDDVLEMHEFLKDFGGDFLSLFGIGK